MDKFFCVAEWVAGQRTTVRVQHYNMKRINIFVGIAGIVGIELELNEKTHIKKGVEAGCNFPVVNEITTT